MLILQLITVKSSYEMYGLKPFVLKVQRTSGIIYVRTIKFHKDNTVGSRLTMAECAYIAGFLDGDGSIMLQVKKRSDSKRGWRIMATICLYQDTRHEASLLWIRKKLGIGYVSHRNDRMTEIRINGFQQIREILHLLLPYIRFKKPQAQAVFSACGLLLRKSIYLFTQREKARLLKYILIVQENNYATRLKKSKEELENIVRLTP